MRDRISMLMNHLASMPAFAHGPATTKEVRQIMLDTGGQMMAQGQLWEIKAKRLGGGVHRVSLSPKGQK
jgi:hypothetical protein